MLKVNKHRLDQLILNDKIFGSRKMNNVADSNGALSLDKNDSWK